ncbi:VOC family protein [Microvirga antarctica]|uniref:VOC family protein n=1 Tax=Microvirga antarctica TaxID=2819233 RepID=UPI001B317FEA|nr:VOC family protein [Microvirga antarctica]
MSTHVKSDNPNVIGLKHMAFAVNDADKALLSYSKFLCVPEDAPVIEYAKSRNRVAIFNLGGIEYQLCQSMDPDGRFASWIKERGGEGLHHICYEVDNIETALTHAQKNGGKLRECKACKVFGSHPHPEGYVAFLDNDAGGIEIEFMQVYTEAELDKYNAVKGI